MSTLYRKYRPQQWSEVADQDHVKITLAAQVESGKIAHAYLFNGPRGVGKTTTARIFARALNCKARPAGKSEPCGGCETCLAAAEGRAMDIIEIDAASHRGIDAVRENIIEHARFAPSAGAYKIFIIDEVHMLTTEAFNALLKTLEEPPKHVVFILATTELHKVPATIVSRCQRFDFRKIAFGEIVERLAALAESEGCKVDSKAIEEIARHAEGCLRDAEGLLGKVLAVGDGKRVTYDDALTVLPRSNFANIADFVESLISQDARTAIMALGEHMDGGGDPDQFAVDAVELLRKVLLAKMSGDAAVVTFELADDQKKLVGEWAAKVDAGRLIRMMDVLLARRRDMKFSHLPQLPLELAAAELCTVASAAIPDVPAAGGAIRDLRAAPPQKVTATLPVTTASSGNQEKKEEQKTVQLAEVALEPAQVPLEKIREIWNEFMRQAGEENHSLPFLLGVAKPIAVMGSKVQIGFDFAFHKDKVNDDKNRKILERVLSAMVGGAVMIEGILLDKKEKMDYTDPVPSVSGKTPAPQGVAALAAAFGGKVVE